MTPKEPSGWTREELEAVASCLTNDLRNAGPRFSIEFTSVSPGARMIASIPPSDVPLEASVPGSGGLFIGDWTEDRLPDEVKRLMGSMHSALGEPADTAIALRVDGKEDMTLVFWSAQDHLEQLEGLLDQVQDAVMESTHEMWPMCPAHEHELVARAAREWVQWQCRATGRAVARFGELAARSL